MRNLHTCNCSLILSRRHYETISPLLLDNPPSWTPSLSFCLNLLSVPRIRTLFPKLSIWFCKPEGVEDNRTIPSATKSKKRTSSSPGNYWKPCFAFSRAKSATWETRREKTIGLNRHPCFTLWGYSKKSDNLAPHLTHDWAQQNMDFTISIILGDVLVFRLCPTICFDRLYRMSSYSRWKMRKLFRHVCCQFCSSLKTSR